MLPEQRAAGTLYDQGLQSRSRKVRETLHLTLKSLYAIFFKNIFPCFNFRCTGENPDPEHIDRQLNNLFDTLKGQTGNTNEVTGKLRIDRGAVIYLLYHIDFTVCVHNSVASS